jgi:DNA modification methylase
MSLELRIGDVFDRMAEIPDGSIDLIVTSPPFLALRSYLPADHPDKAKEIGSEPTPADFIDTLLALSAEWGRVLAPHGSLCVELGDTYSMSGGAGGDYNEDGMRAGQAKFDGSARRSRNKDGWPLAKSMTLIPTLYPASLAYGRNLLTGEPSPAGQWRIRNLIVWSRPNPPVGALGDKFRPATSYITVACKSAKRYFDLDAVRTELLHPGKSATTAKGTAETHRHLNAYDSSTQSAGAPPLDWHTDLPDGDWLWKLSTQPYAGSHYATFPMALPKRLIEAMCPMRVCRECGEPRRRITETTETDTGRKTNGAKARDRVESFAGTTYETRTLASVETVGWSDCSCTPPYRNWTGNELKYRTGVVLDPFAGSGTTLEAAQAVGRHAIGIDLDSRNADLARQRVGMFLNIDEGNAA